MSYNLQIDNANVAAELFEKEFQLAFQSSQKLAGTTQEMMGTMGTVQNVPIFDKIEMFKRDSFAPNNIAPSHQASRNVQVIQAQHLLKTVIGAGEKTLFAFDMIREHAQSHAKAVARAIDKVKIDAVYSADPSEFAITVPVTVGSSTGFTQQKLTQAITALEDQGADVLQENCSTWMPAILIRSLFQDQTVTNLFYSNGRPLQDNIISSYLGIDFRRMSGSAAGVNFIPSKDIGGGVSQWQFPLVHKDALQICFNIAPQTNIVWNPYELRWEAISQMVAGASVIQPLGIALIIANDPAAAN